MSVEKVNPEAKKKIAQKKKADERNAKIGTFLEESILEQLGKPENFTCVKSHHLWGSQFRVNVWGNGRISDSFFVTGTFDGVINSNPLIKKKYKGD